VRVRIGLSGLLRRDYDMLPVSLNPQHAARDLDGYELLVRNERIVPVDVGWRQQVDRFWRVLFDESQHFVLLLVVDLEDRRKLRQ
jgi:hypothetical protein